MGLVTASKFDKELKNVQYININSIKVECNAVVINLL